MFPHWTYRTWLVCGLLLAAMPAAAQDQPEAAPAADASQPAEAQPADAQPQGLFDRDTLTDGWFGLAPVLKEHGIVLGATEISEVLANVTGGTKTGALYDGRLELDLDADLAQLLGLENTVLHVNAYQIHGRGLSANNLGDILTPSSIEAERTIRLFDLWVERGFFDNALSVRLGQIAADDEFITSQYTAGFVNSTFGFPAIAAEALPGGGPEYPLATPGIRVKDALSNTFSLQGALFNGNPDGSVGTVDQEAADISGTNFDTGVSPFLIAELAYTPAGGGEAPAQGTTYKLGGWYQGGDFYDLAVDAQGRSLAGPAASRIPRRHDGDFGFYGIADLLLYRVPGTDDHGLGAFLRMGGAPGDRNFVNFYVDGGFAYKGLFEGRGDDVVSLGAAYAGISGQAEQLVGNLQRIGAKTGVPFRTPDYEGVIELNYEATLAAWWTVQPDLQMVLHPTQAVIRPTASIPLPRMGNALILGLRTSIRF